MPYDGNGKVVHKKFTKKVISKTEWYYEAWFRDDPTEYRLKEKGVEGFKVHYENTGAHEAATDACYDGGTIVNVKIPKTGDSANLLLWALMVIFGLGLAGGTTVYRKRKHM